MNIQQVKKQDGRVLYNPPRWGKVEGRGLAGALWVHMEAALSYAKLHLQKEESLPKTFQAS